MAMTFCLEITFFGEELKHGLHRRRLFTFELLIMPQASNHNVQLDSANHSTKKGKPLVRAVCIFYFDVTARLSFHFANAVYVMVLQR